MSQKDEFTLWTQKCKCRGCNPKWQWCACGPSRHRPVTGRRDYVLSNFPSAQSSEFLSYDMVTTSCQRQTTQPKTWVWFSAVIQQNPPQAVWRVFCDMHNHFGITPKFGTNSKGLRKWLKLAWLSPAELGISGVSWGDGWQDGLKSCFKTLPKKSRHWVPSFPGDSTGLRRKNKKKGKGLLQGIRGSTASGSQLPPHVCSHLGVSRKFKAIWSSLAGQWEDPQTSGFVNKEVFKASICIYCCCHPLVTTSRAPHTSCSIIPFSQETHKQSWDGWPALQGVHTWMEQDHWEFGFLGGGYRGENKGSAEMRARKKR